jgi:glyoxylase-like metal-dependent hydrolase (beta-lactamase superfamily II)
MGHASAYERTFHDSTPSDADHLMGSQYGHQKLSVENLGLDTYERTPMPQRTPAEGRTMSGELRIDRVVTSGTFSLDGGTWDVDNNVWVVGDDDNVVIIDAAHSAEEILAAVGDRNVIAVVATHGHNDHVTVAPELAISAHAPILMHPGDDMLWNDSHPDERYWPLVDEQRISIAGTDLQVIHTPGHSPGSVALYLPEARTLFSGDTLFHGGPGATGRSHSHFSTIIDSIRDQILTLPANTRVFTGHGDPTSVGDEAPHLEEWIARGY